ncbi:MAG: monovalent cation/H+ antiporter subunit D family protein [Gammaproteobacteria bacterium]
MTRQLPALLVVIPLIAAPVCLLLRRPTLVWLLATAVCWVSLAVAWSLLQLVLAEGPLSYAMGGWAPPWGIEYRIDAANAYLALIVTGIASVVLPYARRSVEREIPNSKITYFYILLLLCFTGLLGMTVTGDAFNLFVFLEISSLSTYALISLGKDRRALTAAFQYLVMGTIGGTFVLIGIGFLYVITGTLNMADLAGRLPEVSQSRTLHTAFAFLSVGIGLKLAMFPLHLWLPNAYAYAPSAATAFIAATSTKVAVYALLRFVFSVFGTSIAFEELPFDQIAGVLGALAVLSASAVAIFQQNIRRMLAYSSVAQIGYILLGLSLGTVAGLQASLLHVFNHALMKGALFMAMGCFAYHLGSVHLADLRGIARRMPWTFAAFTASGLSLIGVPLTVGFVSKWYLVVAMLDQGLWPLAILVLVGSLLALIYIWKVIEAGWFGQPTPRANDIREAPLSMLVTTWVLVSANIYFGINTDLTVGVAGKAAEALMGSIPGSMP